MTAVLHPMRYSADYEQRFTAPLNARFTAIESPKQNGRRPLVHAIEVETFGEAAKEVLAERLETLCGQRVHALWRLTPRQPTHGFLISCGVCRGRISVMSRGGE